MEVSVGNSFFVGSSDDDILLSDFFVRVKQKLLFCCCCYIKAAKKSWRFELFETRFSRSSRNGGWGSKTGNDSILKPKLKFKTVASAGVFRSNGRRSLQTDRNEEFGSLEFKVLICFNLFKVTELRIDPSPISGKKNSDRGRKFFGPLAELFRSENCRKKNLPKAEIAKNKMERKKRRIVKKMHQKWGKGFSCYGKKSRIHSYVNFYRFFRAKLPTEMSAMMTRRKWNETERLVCLLFTIQGFWSHCFEIVFSDSFCENCSIFFLPEQRSVGRLNKMNFALSSSLTFSLFLLLYPSLILFRALSQVRF